MRSGVDPIEDQQTGDYEVLPVLRAEQPVKSNKQGCCSASDAADARRVADQLDIPGAGHRRAARGTAVPSARDETLTGTG